MLQAIALQNSLPPLVRGSVYTGGHFKTLTLLQLTMQLSNASTVVND
jgi:hypothetical protein